jgi:16S rRNA processing protein RimM
VEHAARRLTTEQARGSGGQRRTLEPRYLIVGEVIGAHGLEGELKVELTTDDPLRFRRLECLFVGRDGEEPVLRSFAGFRLHKGRALIRLEGCNDRTAADLLRGTLLQIPREEAIPLQEGEYFEHQILGLAVWTADGEHLGRVTEIIYTGANDVYVIRGPQGREILIPAIGGVVLGVDLEAGTLTVALPEGLL